MQHFDDLGIVQSTLQRLMNRQPPLVTVLPKLPGTKEARYAHLLSGEIAGSGSETMKSGAGRAAGDSELHTDRADPAGPGVVQSRGLHDEVIKLRSEVSELRQEVTDLKQQFAAFRQQFD